MVCYAQYVAYESGQLSWSLTEPHSFGCETEFCQN